MIVTMVLAAGEGTRMKSDLPKPLHPVGGRPMVVRVLDTLASVGAACHVVVVGHGADRVVEAVTELAPDLDVRFAVQHTQRGTGDAAAAGLPALDDRVGNGDELVLLPGDTPLVQPSTIEPLVETHRRSGAAATVLTARMDDPTGYGRVIRDDEGLVVRIVEHRDAGPDELATDEVNTSIYCFDLDLVGPALARLQPDNSQGEYYLTDIVEVLRSDGRVIAAHCSADPVDTFGVNDRDQLAVAESELRRRIAAGDREGG